MIKKWMAILMLPLCAGSVSCSDDDDDNSDGTPGNIAELVDPLQVFPTGLPTQVGDLTIVRGADGRVVKIIDGDEVTTFNYDAVSRAANYDMTMNVEWGNDNDGVDFFIRLNRQGFIEYVFEIDEDDEVGTNYDEWWFTYNDLGQLIQMKRTEGNETTTMTYNADGDIVKVEEYDGDDQTTDVTTVHYTNSRYTTMLNNITGIMLYDASLNIDMDEMAVAYYAGLLGKGTKHLPVGITEVEEDGYQYKSNYIWTLVNGKPTRFQEEGNDYDVIDIKW